MLTLGDANRLSDPAYPALSQVNRHRRKGHTARVRAVAGLVNRMLDHQQGS